MRRSRKPLLFSLLCLAVVLGFGYDVLNTRRAHRTRAEERPRSAPNSGSNAAWGSSLAEPRSAELANGTSTGKTSPLGNPWSSQSREAHLLSASSGTPSDPRPIPATNGLRFDPNSDTVLVLELGGYHPPKTRSSDSKGSSRQQHTGTTPANRTRNGGSKTARPPSSAPPRTQRRAGANPDLSRPLRNPQPSGSGQMASNRQAGLDETSHRVRKGESLSEIATRYLGSSRHWKVIADYNRIAQPNLVREGTVLRIPPRANTPGSTPTTGPSPSDRSSGNSGSQTRTCTVQAQDTLSQIAARELGKADRWPEIAKLNGISDPRKIRLGQTLILP